MGTQPSSPRVQRRGRRWPSLKPTVTHSSRGPSGHGVPGARSPLSAGEPVSEETTPRGSTPFRTQSEPRGSGSELVNASGACQRPWGNQLGLLKRLAFRDCLHELPFHRQRAFHHRMGRGHHTPRPTEAALHNTCAPASSGHERPRNAKQSVSVRCECINAHLCHGESVRAEKSKGKDSVHGDITKGENL